MRRIRYLCVLVPALVASCGGTISESDFTKLIVAKLRELDPTITVNVLRPLELEYSSTKTEKPFKAYLNNAYQAYKNGEKLSGIVDKYANSTFKTMVTVSATIGNIVPVVKDDKYIEEVTANVKSNGSSDQEIDFFSVPYVDGLVIMYAVDTPENIRCINKKDFDDLNISESDLRVRAIQNLDRILPEVQLHSGSNVSMITADGNYESSLLLFDKIWSGLQDKVQGKIVAAIPTRDVLLFTGSENTNGISEMKAKVQEVMASGTYTLTRVLFERTSEGWKRYRE